MGDTSMTNELTLEKAIERVEALAESDEPWDPGVPTIHDRTALRLVIEAAREGLEEAVDDAAALSFDEALRIVTRDMHWFRRQAHGNTNPAPLKRKQAAYKMVLEAAKRPTALSGEEREAFTQVLERHMAYARASPISLDVKRFMDALTAALSLASPFTREELEILRDAAAWYPSEAEGCRSHESGLERYYPVAAKLDAYIESRRPRGI
jgi:hypothetical protein